MILSLLPCRLKWMPPLFSRMVRAVSNWEYLGMLPMNSICFKSLLENSYSKLYQRLSSCMISSKVWFSKTNLPYRQLVTISALTVRTVVEASCLLNCDWCPGRSITSPLPLALLSEILPSTKVVSTFLSSLYDFTLNSVPCTVTTCPSVSTRNGRLDSCATLK